MDIPTCTIFLVNYAWLTPRPPPPAGVKLGGHGRGGGGGGMVPIGTGRSPTVG